MCLSKQHVSYKDIFTSKCVSRKMKQLKQVLISQNKSRKIYFQKGQGGGWGARDVRGNWQLTSSQQPLTLPHQGLYDVIFLNIYFMQFKILIHDFNIVMVSIEIKSY